MATTVYGCVNRSTGQVEFDVCGAGDFNGCIERTGEHAGQVKVIVSGTYCDDTYYGCVNRTTGKFQVIVPDDCCEIPCPCEHPEGYTACTECWAEANVPAHLQVEFSDIKHCSDDSIVSCLNDIVFCLDIDSNFSPQCVFFIEDEESEYTDCSAEGGWVSIEISLPRNELTSSVNWLGGFDWLFQNMSFGCPGIYNNDLVKGGCNGQVYYGGTATVINPCA